MNGEYFLEYFCFNRNFSLKWVWHLSISFSFGFFLGGLVLYLFMYLPPLGWKLPPDSLCTNSKLFFPPFFLPNEPVVDDKKYFWDKFLTSKIFVSNFSYYHIIQAIDGRNFVAQNTVPQNIGGRPKISSGKILMVGILLPKILVGEIFLLKILVVDPKYWWSTQNIVGQNIGGRGKCRTFLTWHGLTWPE